MNPSSGNLSPQMITSPSNQNIQKYIEQAERKREYNRLYYQGKVKPKKEQEKRELEVLREKTGGIESTKSQEQIQLENKYRDALQKILELEQKFNQLANENRILRTALEASRQRIYELTMQKTDQILPPLEGLSLSTQS